MTEQQTTARVTIDDVRTVLGDTDPNQTNASKLRASLGRGSFETIQKHLNTLRVELAKTAAPPADAAQLPSLPADAAQAMWSAAWSAAQVQTLRRTEKLAAERDAALLTSETLTLDVAGLVLTIDEQAGQLDQAAAVVAKVQAEHLADVARLEAEHLATKVEHEDTRIWLERYRRDLEKAEANAVNAAALAEAGRSALSQEMARLNDQVSELKAALYKRVDVPAPVTDDKAKA